MEEKRSDKLQNLGGLMKGLGAELHLGEYQEFYDALSDWEGLVGPRVASRTKPLYIVDRVLFVACEGSAWSQEISFRKNAIIKGVNNRLGRALVKDVKCKTEQPPPGATKKKK